MREVIMRKNKRKRLSVSSEIRDVRHRISESIFNTQREIKDRTEETQHSSHTQMHDDGDIGSQAMIHPQAKNRDCPHCNTHFTSPEAYQYHKKAWKVSSQLYLI